MSKFVKTAIAAAMVMGAFTSTATIAAGNNGTARFYGTIEDSVCSIVPDDHKLEVDMGDIGAEKLKNNGTTTPKNFQIRLQDCVFDTQETMTTPLLVPFLLQIAAIITPFSIPIPVRHLTMLAWRSVTLWVPLTKAAWVLTRKS